MIYTVFDIETNGLLEEVTKIHCLSYQTYKNGKLISKGSFQNTEGMKEFLINKTETLVGHNIYLYDIPVLVKLLNIDLTDKKIIDTLALSWYLYNTRDKHGLEQWGEELGVPKPIIKDWQNLTIEEYVHRCETDVEINQLLFHKQWDYLTQLYAEDIPKRTSLLNYINFKLDCVKEMSENPLYLDVKHVEESLNKIDLIREDKKTKLSNVMPLDIKYKTIKKPKAIYKKDGSLSTRGQKWLELLSENNLSEDTEEIEVIDKQLPGNPSSVKQLKDWLFSLGWEPKIYSDDGVPQISDKDKNLCQSIKDLYRVEPNLEHLDQLSVISHRRGILESMLKNKKEDRIALQMGGFTNTFRLKHKKPLVNLPGVYSFYGEEIRGSLIAPEGYIMCGCDMTALEDTTKQHYMYYFDPKYVQEMRTPGFDPHLDVAVLAGLLTPEQAEEHKQGIKKYTQERSLAKTVNFAGIYGAGPPKIASSTGMSLEQAQALHKTYWDRNKSVKQVSESVYIKVFFKNGTHKIYKCKDLQMIIRSIENEIEALWVRQPISNMWISLRYLKDVFSSVNQSSGVYIFDNWVMNLRKKGLVIRYQYHDEILVIIENTSENIENLKSIVKTSIDEVNKKIKPNVPFSCSIDIGTNYAECH